MKRYERNGGQGWIRTNDAFAPDLQSSAFNHSATCPKNLGDILPPSAPRRDDRDK